MKNIIEKLSEILIEHENKSVNDYNNIFDENETLRSTIKELEHIVTTQHEAILKQTHTESTLKKVSESSLKQATAAILKLSETNHKLSVSKKDDKAKKEQVVRLKASNKVLESKVKRLEKKKPSTQNDKLQPLTTVYCKGDDVLLVFPSLLEFGVDGEKKKQATLLYTNKTGCFVTCFLKNDNEVSFSTPINDKSEISQQTRNLIEKNCMSIPNEAADFAQSWLYRVNIQQGTTINPIDLTCFN